jgi:uncharacterized protein (DUF1330 family)
MTAYIIAEIDVTDAADYRHYLAAAPASIAKHGGRYLARGGTCELLEGGPPPKRIVVLEFPSLAAARTWFHSEDYREATELRRRASTARFVVVEGM